MVITETHATLVALELRVILDAAAVDFYASNLFTIERPDDLYDASVAFNEAEYNLYDAEAGLGSFLAQF